MHYRRYDYIKKLLHHRGSPYVKVLYGPRGCGKTTILADFAFRMVRRGFPESRILVITFDDPAVPRDAQTVYEGIISRMEGQEETLLILDEVEKLPHFEKVIDRLFLHRHVDIYLSGSGRSVLTPALKKLLPGRIQPLFVFPLSYREYLSGRKANDERFAEYLTESTYPGIDRSRKAAGMEQLKGMVNTALMEQVLLENPALRASMLNRVVNYIASHAGEPVSLHQMAVALGRAGRPLLKKSVYAYLGALEGSGLLVMAPFIQVADDLGRTVPTAEKACFFYFADPHIGSLYVPDTSRDVQGRLAAAIELCRRFAAISAGKTPYGLVDFITRSQDVETAWQYIPHLKGEEAEKKIRVLQNLSRQYKKRILTLDTVSGEVLGEADPDILVDNLSLWMENKVG